MSSDDPTGWGNGGGNRSGGSGSGGGGGAESGAGSPNWGAQPGTPSHWRRHGDTDPVLASADISSAQGCSAHSLSPFTETMVIHCLYMRLFVRGGSFQINVLVSRHAARIVKCGPRIFPVLFLFLLFLKIFFSFWVQLFHILTKEHTCVRYFITRTR
jgi:hypothetical protein